MAVRTWGEGQGQAMAGGLPGVSGEPTPTTVPVLPVTVLAGVSLPLVRSVGRQRQETARDPALSLR